MFTLLLLACAPDLKPVDTGATTGRDISLSAADSEAADTGPPVETDPPADTGAPADTEAPPDTDLPVACECPDGYGATPADDACQRSVEADPTREAVPANVCAIEPYFAYGQFGARYPGGETVQSSYWGQADGSALGRLNESGVWGCESSGSAAAGGSPVGQWVGFAVCLELDQPGDFLVGVGADNRVRYRVDGVTAFEEDTGSTQAFNYWWMQTVTLTSGTHIIEFEGKNDGNLAGLGAEIAGPFDVGSLIDDATMIAADYEGSLHWSTADAVGGGFDLGESQGWSCPEGYALSRCGEEPVCLQVETTGCL